MGQMHRGAFFEDHAGVVDEADDEIRMPAAIGAAARYTGRVRGAMMRPTQPTS